MFPNLDKDVIDDVVRLKEGRSVVEHPQSMPAKIQLTDLPHSVGLAVDACLALSAGG
jgi:hypothetical protein